MHSLRSALAARLVAPAARSLSAASAHAMGSVGRARVALLGVGAALCGGVAVYRLYVSEAHAADRAPGQSDAHVGRPIVVAGPSGVGKGTLIHKLLTEFPDAYAFSVSHTTRAPRKGEVNGVHYWFVTRADFERLVSEGAFIETNEYNGNLYGTSFEAVQSVAQRGRTCLLDVDINGVIAFKTAKLDHSPRYVFISPPGAQPLAVLEQRLRGRGTEDEGSLQRRLAQAKYELRFRDIPHFFDRVIVNDELETAYAEFRAFCQHRDE